MHLEWDRIFIARLSYLYLGSRLTIFNPALKQSLGDIMCFLALYLLTSAISTFEMVRILRELGYDIRVRGNVIEADLFNRHLKVKIKSNSLALESNDYGPKCLEDLANIINELRYRDYMPRLIVLKSPYLISLEKKKGDTKRLLGMLGLNAKKMYNGYCG